MTLDSYFDRFRQCRKITLVGPFFDNSNEIEEPVIFVDSGTHFRKSGEGISVGDGDSIDTPLEIRLNPDKDFSDLAFALRNIPGHYSEIDLAGFLGGRRDHEIINIGEVHHFLNSRKSPTEIRFDSEVMGFSKGQWQFERFGSFSVLTVVETIVSITGDCRYACPECTVFPPLSSLGLSNIGSGTITINCDGAQ
jgi:thiamine pyrophosphokinase